MSGTAVLTCAELGCAPLEELFARYGLRVAWVEEGAAIPGSYWGEPEAGLIGDTLYLRPDTPVHSALHEGCHWLCMPSRRRPTLHTNVGGSQMEENATCYLQILLAAHLPGMDRMRMCADMDGWGYSFRLGSAWAWFERDAEDARDWLMRHGLLDCVGQPTFRPRQD